MKIVVGIGNPGREYVGTRHNVGFDAVDAYAKEHGFGAWRGRFNSEATEGRVAGETVLLLKPETYVNESGRALRAALDWYHATTQDVIIVVDDFNLPCGKLRVRTGGRSGGHRGLESVSAHVGTDEVPRLKIGIGSPGVTRCGRDFVLSRFPPEERKAVDEAVARAVRALDVWMRSGIERCQNEFNADPPQVQNNSKEADS